MINDNFIYIFQKKVILLYIYIYFIFILFSDIKSFNKARVYIIFIVETSFYNLNFFVKNIYNNEKGTCTYIKILN